MSMTTDNHTSPDRDDEDAAGDSYNAGRAAMERGDMETAVEHLKRSLAAVPHFKTLELLGTACKNASASRRSASVLGSGGRTREPAIRARYLLAEILLERGLIDLAVVKLEEAIELHPQYRAARELLERIRPNHPGVR